MAIRWLRSAGGGGTVARIVVVDDLSLMRMRIRESLLEEGHQVIEATEGVDAVDKYRSTRPDAVLMDLKMPDMNGIDALKRIREFDPSARITLLTGDAQREVVEDARINGAIDFVLKPFTHQRLLDAVAKMLR
ncbi:MAG: response regulator [Chloroflexi bacterium]|nr:response regulator [Chloroflexota bacterium]MDA1173311.1 response regulator [Chloroflexota bacterium]